MSEGLILVTNDGELTHTLMHPKHHIEKTYQVWVDKPPLAIFNSKKHSKEFNKGEILRVKSISEGIHTRQGVIHTIVLEEGRNRHIRRLMECFERKIFRLQRTYIGPLQLDNLKSGEWRRAKPSELKLLRQFIAQNAVDSDGE